MDSNNINAIDLNPPTHNLQSIAYDLKKMVHWMVIRGRGE